MTNTDVWEYQILQLLFPCLVCCLSVLRKIPIKTQGKPMELVLSNFIYLSLRFLKRDKNVEFPLTYSKSLLICWHSHDCSGGNRGKFSKWFSDKRKMYLWVEETKGRIDIQNLQKVAFRFFPPSVCVCLLTKCMKKIQAIYALNSIFMFLFQDYFLHDRSVNFISLTFIEMTYVFKQWKQK